MLKVDLPGRSIGVSFSHPTVIKKVFDDDLLSEHLVTEVKERRSVCQVYELKPDWLPNDIDVTLLGEGVAKCSHLDNFVKETGRKISLTRALAASNLTKDERTAVWQAYRLRNLPIRPTFNKPILVIGARVKGARR